MFSTNPQSLKFALLLFSFSFIAFTFSSAPVFALNIGVQAIDATVSVSKECSRKCESDFCSVPPFLRYGKYCGLLYSGCPGEKPCDGLDACCMKHDACVQSKNNDYLSQECSQNFINCMTNFLKSGGQTFKGNTCQVDDVIEVISVVMKAALLAGRVLHKP
ncbi:phospholipase A2-alpha-like isoform X1 [Pistacia vera]|uniref:Uncharacterized protein n=1 Tax=Pistacia atlantica TaxID=434234 RepID=A0ACC1AIW1_9ROSI|nr:phospholipase A2-alpha-like isoform X1 [Pistacia vera]XP_031286778.1 phospholipase A2-alpha-like isoform X1 [Pistacia vera]KAJ0086605.1 hypothetical protein Patl1_06892 [Pistacia atlantica]